MNGPADETPKVVSSTRVYQGRIVSLRVDEISLSGDRTTTREVIDHPGAVVIIAIDDEEQVYLVRQYRHAIGQMLLEFPAGTLEPGEDPLFTAQRELREEAGLVAQDWTALGHFFSSPGFLKERLDVFVARRLAQQEADPDFDEDLTVVRMPLSQLRRRAVDIPDAKTLAALYLLERDPDSGTRP